MMQLVKIEHLKPSTYNPRKADPQRLKYLELSLRKLGFLMPLYACQKTGEILSGHQRHYVSQQIGLKEVPVKYCDALNMPTRKAVNILFNRATNDLARSETSQSVLKKLQQEDIYNLILNTPDTKDFYPCLHTIKVNGQELARVNIDAADRYCENMARSLSKFIDYMPVIITKERKVINGIGRLFEQLRKGKKEIECVVIPDHAAKLANLMLNYVSMDFDIHTKYESELRYNSFRRANTTRFGGLGRGFCAGVFGNIRGTDFNSQKYPFQKWREKYGNSIIDFGAGRMTDTQILRGLGVEVLPFEPYICQKNIIDKEASVQLAKQFLATIRSGKQFDSIFISSVMNSVPFKADRLHMVTICAALCGKDTLLTIWCMAENHANLLAIKRQGLNERQATNNQFRLDYEKNIILGNFADKPKVQKFHTAEEARELVASSFAKISIKKIGVDYLIEAREPKINFAKLRQAIEFEFNLPYPDGSTMGLVEEARAAFSARLGIKL